MKTKHTIYFLLILAGSVLMASGDRLLRKEYAFSLGMVLLMGGIYLTSATLSGQSEHKGDQETFR